MTDVFIRWNEATANLPWGAQRVFHQTLEAVRDEQIKLAFGADYSNGSPCLVNAAATMLGAINGVGGSGKPSAHYSKLVRAFDDINRYLAPKCNVHDGIVSPLMAEFLIANFAPLKDEPATDTAEAAISTEAFATGTYIEPTDADLMRDFLSALEKEAAPDGTECAPSEAEVFVESAVNEIFADPNRKV